MDELKNYAARAKGDTSLFVSISKNLVNTFVAERELKSQKLYYPALTNELSRIPSYFKKMRSAMDANIVFNFGVADITEAISSIGLEELVKQFQEVKKAGLGRCWYLYRTRSCIIKCWCYC